MYILYLSSYLFIYLFIRKLYLFEFMLLDWLIKLKRSIISVLLQIFYFQKVLNVSDMEYFIYSSMFPQFNVYNIVEEPGRIYLPFIIVIIIIFIIFIIIIISPYQRNTIQALLFKLFDKLIR